VTASDKADHNTDTNKEATTERDAPSRQWRRIPRVRRATGNENTCRQNSLFFSSPFLLHISFFSFSLFFLFLSPRRTEKARQTDRPDRPDRPDKTDHRPDRQTDTQSLHRSRITFIGSPEASRTALCTGTADYGTKSSREKEYWKDLWANLKQQKNILEGSARVRKYRGSTETEAAAKKMNIGRIYSSLRGVTRGEEVIRQHRNRSSSKKMSISSYAVRKSSSEETYYWKYHWAELEALKSLRTKEKRKEKERKNFRDKIERRAKEKKGK
jgi:hypothetical protein